MKKFFIIQLMLMLCLVCKADDRRLIIITFDGLRWQELFTGADPDLIENGRYVGNPAALKKKYWRETPEERRKALMPFTWDYIVKNGYLIGNRNKGSQMQVANKMNFSYPGYSENFCGYPDDKRINSNNPIPNPNVSVLEVANKDKRYKGKVMVYGSWESIRYAVNNERGGFPGSVSYETNLSAKPNSTLKLIDEMLLGMPRYWGEERFDAFTYGYAVETLKQDHPKVMYISFGDTDEWAHSGKYDFYLDATHGTDQFIRRIVETCEADPFYRGKTTYLLTCDHGRGYKGSFTSHGAGTKGSEDTWFMAFGKGVERLGETTYNGPFYNQQFAATIADVLGIDFTPSNGVKQQPIDPHFKGEPLVDVEPFTVFGYFPAIEGVAPAGSGVKYTYYEGEFESVDNMNSASAKGTGVLSTITIEKSKGTDHFGYIFDALLKIEKGGTYVLSCTSDDGSKVFVDGKMVINNDGSHGSSTEEAQMDLQQGFHRLQVKYFEDYEGEMLEVGIEGQGVKAHRIPAEMLYHE